MAVLVDDTNENLTEGNKKCHIGRISDYPGPWLSPCDQWQHYIRGHDCFLWNRPQKVRVFKIKLSTLLSSVSFFPNLPLAPCSIIIVFLLVSLESLWFF
jgi:hypothetical protein